jgi:hypothetical protein
MAAVMAKKAVCASRKKVENFFMQGLTPSNAPIADKKAIDTLIGGKVQLFDNLVQINNTAYSLDTKESDDKTQAA